MSKILVLCILFSFNAFSEKSEDKLDDEAIKKALWASDSSENKLYDACDSSKPRRASQLKLKSNDKIKNGLQQYKECNENMARLEDFVRVDGTIVVDPKAYLDEVKNIIATDHMTYLENHFESSKGNQASIKSKLAELTKKYTQSYTNSEVFNFQTSERLEKPIFDTSTYFKRSQFNSEISTIEFNESVILEKEKLSSTNKYNSNQDPSSIRVDYVVSCFMKNDCNEDLVEESKGKDNIYLHSGSEIVSEGNKTESFIGATDLYFERIAKIILLKLCNFKTVVECNSITTKGFSSIANNELLKSEDVSLLGLESFKMVGYAQALRKFEKYIAIEKENGIFDGQGQRYRGGQTESFCVRNSPYTVDFKACQSVVGAQNIKAVADMAKGTIGGAADQLHKQNIQKQFNRDIASGKSSDEAAFEAQQRAYNGQGNIASTASATYGGSAATLSLMLKSYPSEGSYSKKCENGDSINDKIDYCYILQNVGARELFANKQVKDQAWGMVGQLTGDSLKHALEAMHFNDMAKQTQGMKNDLKGALEEIATVGFDSCANNPELCNNQAGESQTTTLGMGNFNIGSNGYDTQAFVQPGAESTGDIDTSTGISKTEAKQLGDSLRDGGNSLSDSFNKISAGDLGGGSGAPGSGGGGGGSPGGGGGSSSGAAAPQAAAASGASGIPKIKTSYTKGRNIGVKKGGTISNKKSSSPYSNLFNKNTPNRNIASEINDIADKESGLFKKISKRYETLKSKNRLK